MLINIFHEADFDFFRLILQVYYKTITVASNIEVPQNHERLLSNVVHSSGRVNCASYEIMVGKHIPVYIFTNSSNYLSWKDGN